MSTGSHMDNDGDESWMSHNNFCQQEMTLIVTMQ